MAKIDTAPALPVGTVTFLLSDVERSTWLWELAPDTAAASLARHDELIEAAVVARGGVRSEEQGEGDSVVAVFGSAVEAVACARDIQRALDAEEWPEGMRVRVRIGIHTGEARVRDGRNYTGAALHRCARLRDAGHGGQILLSAVTAPIVADALPDGTWLVDHGEHRLKDLARPERIVELCRGELTDGFPPLRSLDVLPNNLPAQLTSFIGRSTELAEVERLLTEQRLLTLTGTGGCGKTRLALQAAADLATRWRDGVWWVDLGAITDPTLVATLTASTVGLLIEPVGGALRALQLQLRDRRMLVCLDTCEHVLDAAAELAETLLRACPEVTVLATSREPLRVPGEMVWRVPSLVDDEAVQLFADRATLVTRAFVPAGDDTAVRTVCRRLDGIPLAVELAAAWRRALTPEQIATGLDDLFRLLVGGPRGVIARQQTLAASMEWSHKLLEETDRAVFRRLAAFAGSFTLEAACAVCAKGTIGEHDVITALGHLVDTSLVAVDEGRGESRYRLLDTIRQYAADRLQAEAETAVTRDRHLDHYLALAERAEPELERDQDTWRHVLETDHDNIRAALRWGLAAPDPEKGRRIAASMARLWFLHGHTPEGVSLLKQAIERAPDDRSTLQARLLSAAALLALGAGQPTVAAETAQRGLEIAIANDDDSSRARCLVIAAYGSLYSDFSAMVALCREARPYAERSGDIFVTDLSLQMEASGLGTVDRHEEGARLGREVFERVMPRGERFCAVFARECEAYHAVFTGDVRRANELATDAARIAEPLADYFTVRHSLGNLAWIKNVAGEIDAGRQLLDPIVRSIDDAAADVADIDVSYVALALGKLHLSGGDFEGAVEWFKRGTRFAAPTTDNWVVARSLPGLATALRRLGRTDEAREHANRAIAMARKIDARYVLAEALEEAAFLVAGDDPERAEGLHHEALAVRVEHGLRTFYVDSLEALAGLAADAEGFGEAARLAAASDAAREPMGYPRPSVNQPDYDAMVATVRAALGADEFEAAWSEGSALSLDEAVAYARRARGARGRPSSGWASLTPTELDVIRLVVEGLTNPQIGARLFVSRATVKTHLSHIYAKLGVANRTELATLANARPD